MGLRTGPLDNLAWSRRSSQPNVFLVPPENDLESSEQTPDGS